MDYTIGETIRFIRKNEDLKQKELASKAGISNTYLSDIENGRTEPSIKTVRKIAKALNMNWRQFFLPHIYVNYEQSN